LAREFRPKELGASSLNLAKFTEWINAHQPDDDLDKVFVAAFEFSKDPLQFRFLLTTNRILRSCPIIKHLLADATYKLLLEGLPVLTIGVTDRLKRIHLLGLVISTNETYLDFAFMFKSLKDAIYNETGVLIK
jgi:hypothetical protein